MNREAEKLLAAKLRLRNQQGADMQRIAGIAREFFLYNFKKEGSDQGSFQAWPKKRLPEFGKRRQLLRQSGDLQRSIRTKSSKRNAMVISDLPYSKMHNDGGEITITPKMRRFFWAKYYEVMGKAKSKDGLTSSLKKAQRLKPEATMWRNLAMKRGKTLKIPPRPFIYNSRTLDAKIIRYLDSQIKKI